MESLPASTVANGVGHLSSLRNVPNEVLNHIFVLCSGGNPIKLSYYRPRVALYQVAISQVCSRWRQIALHTGALWSNINTNILNYHGNYPQVLFICQTSVTRAGSHPLTVKIRHYCSRKALLDFVIPFQLKTLFMASLYTNLSALSKYPMLDVEEPRFC